MWVNLAHDQRMLKDQGQEAIVIMGVCGSGKSCVGRSLASALGCDFLEGDSLHLPQSIEMMSRGEALGDAQRMPWLDAIAERAEARRRFNRVVVTCSALKRAYRDRLREKIGKIVFVHLSAPPAVISQRIRARRGHFATSALLESQLRTLERPEKDERAIEVLVVEDRQAVTHRVIQLLLNQVNQPSNGEHHETP